MPPPAPSPSPTKHVYSRQPSLSGRKPSDTPTSTPRKSTAGTPPSSTCPTITILLLRNLSFLDLDLLPDWPNLTQSTFCSARDVITGQKDRVRAAEWLLYHLFSIWDGREMKAKLRQFFPALEPLQSIKLRAALVQWLTQLKTAGVLGRECMIRKSMLDECRGERFEEVLLHFSTAVLEKVVGVRGRKQGLPVAQLLALKKQWNAADEELARALTWAQEGSLRRLLDVRANQTSKLQVTERQLKEKGEALDVEKRLAESELGAHEVKLKLAKVDSQELKRRIRNDCRGDAHWLSIMISGDVEHDRDAMVENSLENIWSTTLDGTSTSHESSPDSLLADLEQRVNSQRERLESWRSFQKEVSKRNEQFIVSQSPFKSPLKSPRKAMAGSAHSIPRRQPSTRKRDSARTQEKSRRLQELQVSPTKPRLHAQHPAKSTEMQHSESGASKPIATGTPIRTQQVIQPQSGPSHNRVSNVDTVAEDLAQIDSSSPPAEATPATPAIRSRIPSPTKLPSRSPTRKIPTSKDSAAASGRAALGKGAQLDSTGYNQAPTQANVHLPETPARQISPKHRKTPSSVGEHESSFQRPLSSPLALRSARHQPATASSPESLEPTKAPSVTPPSHFESLNERTQRTLALLQSSKPPSQPLPKSAATTHAGDTPVSRHYGRVQPKSMQETYPINPFGGTLAREFTYMNTQRPDVSPPCTPIKVGPSSEIAVEDQAILGAESMSPVERDDFPVSTKSPMRHTPPSETPRPRQATYNMPASPELPDLSSPSPAPLAASPQLPVHAPPQQSPESARPDNRPIRPMQSKTGDLSMKYSPELADQKQGSGSSPDSHSRSHTHSRHKQDHPRPPHTSSPPEVQQHTDSLNFAAFTRNQVPPVTIPVSHAKLKTPPKTPPETPSEPDAPKTPPESLFEAEVEAASVFKTRSKLRRSPVGSPSPGFWG